MSPFLFDTHCHLDSLKSLSFEAILEKARQVNVREMITIAVEPKHLDEVIEIAHRDERIFCTQGIHPHEAILYNEEVRQKIIENAKREKKVVALGEMGLDYHYNHSPREKQREVFESQLQLACDLDLPVVIHTREADDDTLAILQNFSPSLKRKGVLHSFTSGKLLAEKSLDEGFSIGFNGIITFKNAEAIREILKNTPQNRILFETDAPYLTPVPYRGRENGPYYLPYVAHKAAEVLNVPYVELLEQVYQNSIKLFGLAN